MRNQELRDVARRIWDCEVSSDKPPPALNNDQSHNSDLRRARPRHRLDNYKEPQAREDFERTTTTKLVFWIGCQGVEQQPYYRGGRTLSKCLALAQTVWDAKEAGDLDSLPKRKGAPPNKVTVPTVREDIQRMNRANMILWIRSKGVVIRLIRRKKEL